MKILKTFTDFITENSDSTYDKGCAMLFFDFPEMSKIHDKIDPNDIYEEDGDNTYGLEDEPHVTLLYGLDPKVKPEQVKEIVNDFDFGKCTMYNASLFKNEYDVLKFDAKGNGLHKCNRALTKLPYENSYPDYHPHMTIAYLKEGKGKKYINMLKGQEYELTPSHIIFTQPNGTKNRIELK